MVSAAPSAKAALAHRCMPFIHDDAHMLQPINNITVDAAPAKAAKSSILTISGHSSRSHSLVSAPHLMQCAACCATPAHMPRDQHNEILALLLTGASEPAQCWQQVCRMHVPKGQHFNLPEHRCMPTCCFNIDCRLSCQKHCRLNRLDCRLFT